MNILFLCTGNSCRSILAEAIFNALAPAGMRAMSAGSDPTGKVHPRSIALLTQKGITTEGYYSNHGMIYLLYLILSLPFAAMRLVKLALLISEKLSVHIGVLMIQPKQRARMPKLMSASKVHMQLCEKGLRHS